MTPDNVASKEVRKTTEVYIPVMTFVYTPVCIHFKDVLGVLVNLYCLGFKTISYNTLEFSIHMEM